MFYHFRIHKGGKKEGGYWAECVELDGAVTQGDTLKELRRNMEEALNLYLDEREDPSLVFPLPKKKVRGKNIERVKVNPSIAFAVATRAARAANKLSQRKAAARMGIPLRSFQLLESSRTANPRWDTVRKLLQAFPNFPIDLLTTGLKESA